jgi:hypothetical protein
MAAAVVEEDGFQDGGRRLCLSLLESNWMKLLAKSFLLTITSTMSIALFTLDYSKGTCVL